MTINRSLFAPLVLLVIGCDNVNSSSDGQGGRATNVSISSDVADSKKSEIMKIQEIEAQIALPKETYELTRYERYYILDGDRFGATYIRSLNGVGSIHIVESKNEMPYLLDGGCQVVNLSGKISALEKASVFCNGIG